MTQNVFSAEKTNLLKVLRNFLNYEVLSTISFCVTLAQTILRIAKSNCHIGIVARKVILIFFAKDSVTGNHSLVSVPPLEGFVMNRVLGDYFETLLYKIFVSIDEHTSVAEVGRPFSR